MVLSGLKVGDKVALYTSDGSVYLSVVEKSSSTHLTIRAQKYNVGTGQPVGDHYGTAHVTKLTPEVEADIKVSRGKRDAMKLVQAIKGLDYSKIDIMVLKKVLKMLEEGME